jgi:hypothetical protein
MAHNETEHDDLKLREMGFDAGAPAEQAVARLKTLRGTPGVSDAAIARALGAIADSEAAEVLTAMAAGAVGATRREVRRALFKLRQRGIGAAVAADAVASPANSSLASSSDTGLSALFSPIDAEGARVVWLLKARPRGGLARLWGLVSDVEGLAEVALAEVTRKESRAERSELERRAGISMVEGDWHLADFTLCEAYRRTPEARRGHVGNFLTLRAEIISSAAPAQLDHPVYAELASAVAREPSPDLLKEAEASALRFSPADIKPYVDEIKSIQESTLVLNRYQQEERINAIVERAIGELLTGDHAQRMRRRLEDIAYYMAHARRTEAAGWAVAAAARLRDGAEPRRSGFFQALVRAQLGAVFSEAREREREAPHLIMTPAEAMRAQQQARARRR